MKAHVISCHDAFRPAFCRSVVEVRRRRSLRNLAPRTRSPVVCQLNGQWISRKAWALRVKDGDVVVFVTLPQGGGGGGSNPLKIILMIVVMVFAWFAAPYVAGAMGVTSAAGVAVVQAGIGLLGSALINALIPPPKPPAAQQANALAAASPTYSLGAQGNTARLGQPIPVIYGRHLVYPDFASAPYVEYVGNEQYLYQLLCVGQGEYDIESIRIEDTPLSSFPEITTEIVPPGGRVMLFPANVITSIEVSGQEAQSSAALGPFVATSPGTLCNYLGIDVVLPRGLYYATDSGALSGISCQWRVEAQLIDNSGNALAGWFSLTPTDYFGPWSPWSWFQEGTTLPASTDSTDYRVFDAGGWVRDGYGEGASDPYWVSSMQVQKRTRPVYYQSETVADATTTPIRLSYKYAVPEGRYQVRFLRRDAKFSENRYGHDLVWAGLRAYIPGNQQYGDVTLLAMRLRATNSLSQQASRKVNLIATRKLKTWSPATGWSAQAVTTRSIAWAIADICRASYGAGFPDSRIDLAGLHALDAIWSARGDSFNAVLDSQSTVMEALSMAARCGRAVPYQQGGILRIFRDQPASIPVQMFTTRNIVKGSLKIEYMMPSEENVDALDVTYFDERVWAERTVRAQLPGSTAAKVGKIKIFGATNRDQAWREGMFSVACNVYRRRFPVFGSEMEGFIPTLGDLIAIQHDMPKWGQSGEIVAWNAETKEAILSEPLDWSAGGAHVLAFRRRNGSPAGPFITTAGTDAYRVILNNWAAATDPTPDIGGDRERSHYAFGPSNAQFIRARLLSMRPKSAETAEIAAVVESDYVHVADTGVPPTESAWQLPTLPTLPVISSLSIAADPMLRGSVILSWPPARGAQSYQIERANERGGWERVDQTVLTSLSVPLLEGVNSRWRAAAMGELARGAWREAAWINYLKIPESVVNFGISVTGGVATLTLDFPADDVVRRLGRLHIRHSPRLTGAVWDSASPLIECAPASSVPVRLLTGTYLAKWEDSLGSFSAQAVGVINELGDAFVANNIVDELSDDGVWGGLKSNVGFDAALGGVKLIGAGVWDSQTAPIDTWGDLDSVGGVLPSGHYQFSREIDLGRVATCRLMPKVVFSAYSPLDDWDSRPGDFDTWGDIDSPTISNSRAGIEVSTSQDGAAWSPWAPIGAGDLGFRKLRARIALASDDPSINVVVRSAALVVDMPDLLQQGVDVVSSISGALRITYPERYQRSPALVVEAQGMQPGDSYEISAKDVTGFSIVFRNQAAALVLRTFDWQAKSY